MAPRYNFQRSTRAHKKYMVEVDGRVVHFGDSRYQHYKDRTGKGLWSHLDHLDPDRRRAYKQRHERDRHVTHSPGWFADRYLW
jgi:hypothetical protein